MNNRINASNWTQGPHQAAHGNQANIPNSFSELHRISNLTESLAYPYHRVETSATTDLRSSSTTSGEVQLSGEHNSAALAQDHLKPSKPNPKLVPVPPEYWLSHENEHSLISPNALAQRKYRKGLVPVPPEFRINNEDEHTLISPDVLTQRKHRRVLVPVPPEFRINNEDEYALISPDALAQRKRRRTCVPVPPEYRRDNENEHTRISPNALILRKRNKEGVPVPLEYRRDNENEHTRISPNALTLRKHKKLKSAALSSEKSHASHQAGETSVVNTLTDSNSARQNSPIFTRSPSGSNAAPLHETTPQGTMENYESLPQFVSDTAFSHWLDDVDAQQSAIDYMLYCHWKNGIP